MSFSVGYTVLYDYEVGEVISVTNIETQAARKAEVLSLDKDNSMIKIRFLDTMEIEDWTHEMLSYHANLPLHTMLEMAEGLMSIWMRAITILQEEEREHVMQTVVCLDRMIGESTRDNLKLLHLPTDELCVVLDEEYGYKHHLWFPKMTEEELVKWWENLETVNGFFFDPASTLPGEVVTMQTRELLAMWRALECAKNLPYAHIHSDGDSHLTTVDGVDHLHKGYDEHYYDPKPCDTVMETDDDGNIVDGPRQREENPCCGCPHHAACQRENKDEEQVDVPDLPDDSGEGKGS